jgi:superfamily I DNA and/or RNA helicase
MTREEAIIIEDVTQLSYLNRWRLYRFWVRLYTQSKRNINTIERMKRMFLNQIKRLDNLKYEQNMIVIRRRNVIGMTTTGAEKHRKIIESIDPQIVVIEEAAEVLESHVITSLTRSTDHLILIGDHQQLRPNPSVCELAKKFDLDVSLFERMIRNK